MLRVYRGKQIPHSKRVRVWNVGPAAISAVIEGTTYTIPSQGNIEVGRREALNIRNFCPGKDQFGNMIPWMLDFECMIDSGTSMRSDKQTECPLCGVQFLTSQKALYVEHLKQCAAQHGQTPPTQAVIAESTSTASPGVLFACPFCDFAGSSKAELAEHIKTEHAAAENLKPPKRGRPKGSKNRPAAKAEAAATAAV
jgi:hypothetical protein